MSTDDGFQPKREGRSRQSVEMELCELVAKNPDRCSQLEVSPVKIIRDAIEKRDKDDQDNGQVGQLWVHLAEFFIRLGDFEMAIEIFEEALETRVNGVRSVKDFTLVFNSYLKFEQ